MKTKVFMAICCLLCVLCQSCKEDEKEGGEISLPKENFDDDSGLLDGGQISDMGFYCLENNRTDGSPWFEYYPRTKTVSDYNSFKLLLMFNEKDIPLNRENLEECLALANLYSNYYREKSMFIWKSYDDYRQHSDAGWPELFTAYTNGEVTITCDKTLFGEEPGTNLSSYLTVISRGSQCLPVGIENPTFLYNYGEKAPTKASELFADGTWLQPKYFLEFAEQPSEKYEELTLSVSWPMIREHIWSFIEAKYKGEDPKPVFTESTFEAKCLIKFDWK